MELLDVDLRWGINGGWMLRVVSREAFGKDFVVH